MLTSNDARRVGRGSFLRCSKSGRPFTLSKYCLENVFITYKYLYFNKILVPGLHQPILACFVSAFDYNDVRN